MKTIVNVEDSRMKIDKRKDHSYRQSKIVEEEESEA